MNTYEPYTIHLLHYTDDCCSFKHCTKNSFWLKVIFVGFDIQNLREDERRLLNQFQQFQQVSSVSTSSNCHIFSTAELPGLCLVDSYRYPYYESIWIIITNQEHQPASLSNQQGYSQWLRSLSMWSTALVDNQLLVTKSPLTSSSLARKNWSGPVDGCWFKGIFTGNIRKPWFIHVYTWHLCLYNVDSIYVQCSCWFSFHELVGTWTHYSCQHVGSPGPEEKSQVPRAATSDSQLHYI